MNWWLFGGLVAAIWAAFALFAWALCRVAHDSDELDMDAFDERFRRSFNCEEDEHE
jgi:hypothetical protein